MRFVFPLAILLAGAQALTQPVAKRQSLDICAYVDADLEVTNPLTGSPLVLGLLEICLCVSGIPSFIQTNPITILAVAIVGAPKVQAAVAALITTASNSQHCTYPDNCTPVCSPTHPCGFTCHGGFTPSPPINPTECVCEYPKHVCNGICTISPCSTYAPRKRENEWQKRVVCDTGLTPCGLYSGLSRGSREAYECVDATADLESCGGCSVPLHESSPLGVDCTSLPGVADVSCRAGSCLVHRCMPGYQIAHDRSMCVDVEVLEKILLESDYHLAHSPFHGRDL